MCHSVQQPRGGALEPHSRGWIGGCREWFESYFPLRYFLTDLRLKRTHDVCQVWSVSPGGAEAAHSRVRGSFLWLHGALCADVLPSSGTSSVPSIPERQFVSSDTSTFVFASRRRSCWTRSWTCWWPTLPLNASCGCRSCTDLPT